MCCAAPLCTQALDPTQDESHPLSARPSAELMALLYATQPTVPLLLALFFLTLVGQVCSYCRPLLI